MTPMYRGIKQARKDADRFGLEPIARQPQGTQRVIVRPDGAIVGRHQVMARFALSDRANAPSR